ncbi:unnamed protein product [Didymodactylos carnosus]|uniref:Peptidase C1A papain C-terminal domain-containing protein n=1 Tax=Didymodactylos carnosus TaxID=1234261 RepID=A0A815N6J1_9BILA|nr:unnamed protein product [Didymodactylos carnosus]CAF4308923.1 unnamed protein product [Didymodactylos carnosus]
MWVLQEVNEFSKTSVMSIPDTLDWRKNGIITNVKQEGRNFLGSSIVAVELIESLHAAETKQLVEGSIARVADCCPQSQDVFECIKKLGGICSVSDYPEPKGKCESNACKPFATLQLVGYGKTDFGDLYWICKNSWGVQWGEIRCSNRTNVRMN